MKRSSDNSILSQGRINFPEHPRFTPSECYPLPFSNQYLLSTFSLSEREKSGPVLTFSWDQKRQEPVIQAGLIGYDFRSVHARNLGILASGEMMILTDHGSDLPPFPGGFSRLLKKKSNVWEIKNLLSTPHFHFDVAITEKVKGNLVLAVLTNLSSFENSVLILNSKGEFEPVQNAWPAEISFTQWISVSFTDIDGDGIDELILGGRGGRDRDLILRWDGKKFINSKILLPNKLNQDWETISIQAVDMNKGGNPDLISLNHDKKISHGSLEVYLNQAQGFKLMEMDSKLQECSAIPNRWLHRCQPFDLTGSGFPDLSILTRKTDFLQDNQESLLFFALNKNGQKLEHGAYDLFQEEKYILASCISDFSGDGRPELLLIRFDGHWTLSTINPFN